MFSKSWKVGEKMGLGQYPLCCNMSDDGPIRVVMHVGSYLSDI